MSNPRVDYSELVETLQKGDDAKASKLLSELIPRLEDYLRVVMSADRHVAKECVQQAFLAVLEQIRQKNIENSQYIYSYLLKTCKHEYFSYTKRQHKFKYDDGTFRGVYEPEEQLMNLIDEERQVILEECLNELGEENREFIEYFIDKPYANIDEVVDEFDLSNANVRTKKHRLLSRLHHCYKRKSNQ